MTENEIKLISLLRSAVDTEKAMLIAIEIILQCLEQPESFEAPSVAYSLELV